MKENRTKARVWTQDLVVLENLTVELSDHGAAESAVRQRCSVTCVSWGWQRCSCSLSLKKVQKHSIKKTFCLSFKQMFCCCCCFLNYYLNFFLFFVSRIMSCRQSAAYQVALFIPVIPNLRAVAQSWAASTTKRAAKMTAKVINWRLNWKLIWKLHKTTIVFLCIFFFKCSDLDQKESLCTSLRSDYVQTTPYLRASCWGFNYNPRTHSCKGFFGQRQLWVGPRGQIHTRERGRFITSLPCGSSWTWVSESDRSRSSSSTVGG